MQNDIDKICEHYHDVLTEKLTEIINDESLSKREKLASMLAIATTIEKNYDIEVIDIMHFGDIHDKWKKYSKQFFNQRYYSASPSPE